MLIFTTLCEVFDVNLFFLCVWIDWIPINNKNSRIVREKTEGCSYIVLKYTNKRSFIPAPLYSFTCFARSTLKACSHVRLKCTYTYPSPFSFDSEFLSKRKTLRYNNSSGTMLWKRATVMTVINTPRIKMEKKSSFEGIRLQFVFSNSTLV